MTQTELTAFEGQVNLEPLDDIISFAVHTAEPDWTKKDNLRRRRIFPNQTCWRRCAPVQVQLLYLGELLERYEERFGMSVQDRRAIVLALGCTREIATEKMFVGTHLSDFIQAAMQNAKDDIYLTGALYLGGDKIAARVVCDDLEHLLQSKGCVLTQDEAGRFLDICGKLVRCGVMDWPETQSRISKIKEALPDDSNCNSAA